jgi:hypothetical protein
MQEGNVNITAIASEFGITTTFAANSSVDVISNSDYYNYLLNKNVIFYTFVVQKDLDNIRINLSGKYILVNDINLDENKAGFEDISGWFPIGNSSSYFTGILEGNNHKITNLWINRTTTHVGLFGYIRNAQVKNLGVETAEDKEIKGTANYVGGITGYNYNSNIDNSYFVGTEVIMSAV